MIIRSGYVSEDIKNYFISIVLNNVNFPWYYCDTQVTKNKTTSYNGFVHIFHDAAENKSSLKDKVLDLLITILKQENIPSSKIKGYTVMRANLLLPLDKTLFNEKEQIHIDKGKDKFISVLYYVNDSDGDTIFYDDKDNILESSTPKAGKYILFKSNNRHAATLPSNTKKRCVITMVLELNEPL